MYVRLPGRLFKENFYHRAARDIARYIKATPALHGAEWMYAHFLTDNGYIGTKVKELTGIKLAAIARGDDVHAWPEYHPHLVSNIRYVFEHADVMLANNKGLARDAMKFADKVKPDIKIAYNGVDYKAFRFEPLTASQQQEARAKYNLPADKKILMCIGRAEETKGWIELLQAVAENKQLLSDWVLLAVTDQYPGYRHVAVADKVKELGISDMVRVQYFVLPEQVKELYRVSNAFILPSYNEGISNAVMEAMASGLWVITTDVGGHAEIIQHGKGGFLMRPQSMEDVTANLRYLVANYDEQHAAISNAAMASMEQLGDYRHNAKILLGYLEASGK